MESQGPTYEAPQLTVLGSVADLTEVKTAGQPDPGGLDGASSFNIPD